ncbi:hypothetical protein HPULCUR_004570 [Helicostylum pulchrum]|uniref:Uncharacterized protein n=1 Tax=Helicostylum pulchrum TaxID=562976 RepID=A0ABP9XXV6_9FUNG
MACPDGWANGGGQLPDWVSHVKSIYQTSHGVLPENKEIISDPNSEIARQLLRTQYHAFTQNLGNPLATMW